MTIETKRAVVLAILEILKRNTDAQHKLLQADILRSLEADYGITVTRKTLRQHLSDLEEAGYPIAYDEGWYYEGDFCEAELNFLYNSVLFSEYLSDRQRKEMLQKIKALGSSYYAPKAFAGSAPSTNQHFLLALEVMQEAIDAGRKVEFRYARYDVDKKLHIRTNEDGTPYIYLFNPYRIVISNGRHYVIGNMDKYSNTAHFRMDKILDCKITDVPVKPMYEVQGLEYGLQIPEYMAGHAFMFTGKSEQARLRIKRKIVGDVLDHFGMNVRFENVTDQEADAIVSADAGSLHYWLKQYDEQARRID